ncbi:MAG: hypothetical protein E5X48_01335 [Mesorhizobium sp.]|uniref:CU044_2847 family protein n=1 Tax=Mesorhizobium sp. TaxID=1871066 RepID=UPI0012071750|nr:CU044_2847 family protein [Mesorhizobium sp.]TIQ38541.1 MAG: hypothetical protein E5X48_01335 [Mesorhizobium sp.]
MALLEVASKHGTFLVEVKPGSGLAGTAAGDPLAIIGRAEATLEDILDSVGRIGAAASEKLSKIKIEQADLEIGVKFGASGGFFFAEVAGEATLTLKLSLKGAA